MNSRYPWLALAALALLPACTVNYYGVAPDGRPYGPHHSSVVQHSSTDTVYVSGSTSTTTVITQPGTVGGPRGGYASNGPGRTTPAPGSYPPPPPPRQPAVAAVPPPPPVRLPPAGPAVPPSGHTGGQSGSHAGGNHAGTSSPTPAPGHSQPSAPLPNHPLPGTPAPAPSPVPAPAPVPSPTPSGGTPVEPPYQTGGVKPMPTTPTPSNTNSAPIRTETGGSGPRIVRTGGIKPSRDTSVPTNPTNDQPVMIPTGGIKPMPTTPAADNTAGLPTGSEPLGQPGGVKPHATGGIKPSRETVNAGPGRVVTEETGLSTVPTPAPVPMGTPSAGGLSTAAVPALMFEKMPCRGTCPSYSVTIWPNGRVLYVGQQNMSRLGTYELHLEPATVASIQQQAKSANFMALPASFSNGAADIPASVMTMYGAKGEPKAVTVESGAPEEVQALFDYVHGTVMQLVANGQFPEERAVPRRGR